jgi:hypothetical protein
MKSLVSLLLVLLFASCGKQEVYEFRHEESNSWEKTYDVDDKGKNVEFVYSSSQTREGRKLKMKQHMYVSDNYPRKKQNINVVHWVEFKFTPIYEDGFCFYTYRGNIYRNEKPTDRYKIHNERIVKVLFMDEQENVLFTYPFVDSYDTEKRVENYDVQGKTKSVTRALLERVEKEEIQIRSKFEWKWNDSFSRRKIDFVNVDLSEYEKHFQ